MASTQGLWNRGWFKTLIFGGGGFLLLLIIFGLFTATVGPTERGVYVKLGQVQNEVLQPGFHFKAPFVEHVQTYSIVPIELSFSISIDDAHHGDKQGAITKDNQAVGLDYNIFYSFDENKILDIARSFNRDSIESNLKTSMTAALKTVIGQYTIYDVATNQDKIRDATYVEFKRYIGEWPVVVKQVNITNYDWPKSFTDSINQTMQIAQQVKAKTQELQVADLESQKAVKIAESQKQALIAQAEGDKQAAILRGDAKAAEGEGIRKYNQSIAQNPELALRLKQIEVELARISKWDGHYVPTQNYAPIPFQHGSLQGEK